MPSAGPGGFEAELNTAAVDARTRCTSGVLESSRAGVSVSGAELGAGSEASQSHGAVLPGLLSNFYSDEHKQRAAMWRI
ncbi:unnamed protein product [Gadus morhua 'NCC']